MSLLPFSETTNLILSDGLVFGTSVVDAADVSIDVVVGWNVVDVVFVTTLSNDNVDEVSANGVVSIGSVNPPGINSTETEPSVDGSGGSTTVVGLTSYSVVLDPSSVGKIIEGSFSACNSGKSWGYKREKNVSGAAVVVSSSLSVEFSILVELGAASWTVCESIFQLHKLPSKLQSSRLTAASSGKTRSRDKKRIC